MKVICFIPVRKGSKGIPGKNIRLLGDKPLICWILDSVLLSHIADEICVATDCDKTMNLINRRYGTVVNVFRRSHWTARDESPTIDVVREYLENSNAAPDDLFILLQATSPFTQVKELCNLHQEMLKRAYDSYIACYRLKKFRWSDNGEPLDYTFETKPRRQEYKGLLIESGAFYASTVGRILFSGQLLSGSVKVIEVGEAGMIDIDEENDWQLAEHYLKTYEASLGN